MWRSGPGNASRRIHGLEDRYYNTANEFPVFFPVISETPRERDPRLGQPRRQLAEIPSRGDLKGKPHPAGRSPCASTITRPFSLATMLKPTTRLLVELALENGQRRKRNSLDLQH